MIRSTGTLKPDRPAPLVLADKPPVLGRELSLHEAVERLISGKYVLIEDQFPAGLKVLARLKKQVFGDAGKEDFVAYRKKRSEYHLASNRLLVPIEKNTVALKKAPDIGWLEKLYPDIGDFLLPFPQVQGLNSSWQWYIKGVDYPVLDEKLYPFYSVYFPTRFDHLYLFDYWLKKYSGPKATALDLGTGSGVLAFQLLKRRVEMVYATDISPNSIISVVENAKRMGVEDRLKAWRSDLFGDIDQKADLIVFNPPWLPARKDIGGLDRAIYYEPGLFERFFDHARHHVNEEGRIAILFSNFARVAGIEQTHPVESELTENDRYRKVKRIKRKAASPSKKSKRRDNREGEYVELWELKVV